MKVSLTLSLFFRLSDEGHSGHDKFVPRVPRRSDEIIGNSRRVCFCDRQIRQYGQRDVSWERSTETHIKC